ncbi:hypothetical protein [Petroclostridium sp. X23]|uniref:LptM family lipoprotein n=1 Tax=Petroclostridium sp. X23 TaxID=3045146 RepID=UPI0024AE515C|nr:hypothetical protein [Petroclostridium sp. X23]WHH56929.1 hypothetical protein QKW49_13830 [Petroclostridium sp. X23]
MKKMILFMVMLLSILLAAACGQNVPSASNETKKQTSPERQAKDKDIKEESTKRSRISFDRNDSEDVSYIQHLKSLWEQTKPLLREDLNKNYSDEEYKKLGTEIDMAWINLQIHTSFSHMEELDKIKDVKLTNLDGDIIQLIDELYGNRYAGSVEKREERREILRKGRLEKKIKEFDSTLNSTN